MPLHSFVFMFAGIKSGTDEYDRPLWICSSFVHEHFCFFEQGSVFGVDTGIEICFGNIRLEVDIFAEMISARLRL